MEDWKEVDDGKKGLVWFRGVFMRGRLSWMMVVEGCNDGYDDDGWLFCMKMVVILMASDEEFEGRWKMMMKGELCMRESKKKEKVLIIFFLFIRVITLFIFDFYFLLKNQTPCVVWKLPVPSLITFQLQIYIVYAN